jgi:FtsZ-interacting cell division protein ZipA
MSSNNNKTNIIKYFFTNYRKENPVIFGLAIFSIVAVILVVTVAIISAIMGIIYLIWRKYFKREEKYIKREVKKEEEIDDEDEDIMEIDVKKGEGEGQQEKKKKPPSRPVPQKLTKRKISMELSPIKSEDIPKYKPIKQLPSRRKEKMKKKIKMEISEPSEEIEEIKKKKKQEEKVFRKYHSIIQKPPKQILI